MDPQYEPIRRLLSVVRGRHRALMTCMAVARAALGASAVVVVALTVAWAISFVTRSPWLIAVAGLLALLSAMAAAVWGLKALRHVPSDARIARFIEERGPEFEDRLATAVHAVQSGAPRASSVLIAPLVDEVAHRAEA